MRKRFFITLIIVVMSFYGLYAGTPLADNNTSHTQTTNIRVRVTGTVGEDVSYDIGFSKNNIPQWSVQPIHYEHGTFSLIPAYNEDGNIIAESKANTLFLYWRIVSETDVNIAIGLAGPMKNGTSELGWTVSWPPYDDASKVVAAAQEEAAAAVGAPIPSLSVPDYNQVVFTTIKSLPKLPAASSIAGAIPLKVYTDSLKGKIATTGTAYAGAICIKVSVS